MPTTTILSPRPVIFVAGIDAENSGDDATAVSLFQQIKDLPEAWPGDLELRLCAAKANAEGKPLRSIPGRESGRGEQGGLRVKEMRRATNSRPISLFTLSPPSLYPNTLTVPAAVAALSSNSTCFTYTSSSNDCPSSPLSRLCSTYVTFPSGMIR